MISVDLFLSDSEYSDDDFELMDTLIDMPISRRCLRDLSNPLEIPESQFLSYFRLTKALFKSVLKDFEEEIRPAIRSHAISPLLKLALILRFFACGSHQEAVGNDWISPVAQGTFSVILQEFLQKMETPFCSKWISFNISNEEISSIKQSFYDRTGFPGVVGCVDGTHVNIMGSSKPDGHLYINRKGRSSLNVMLVCDHRLMIRFVDARHPGGCHDSFVFQKSSVNAEMKNRHENGTKNTWLLGDSGYALSPYLITPFKVTSSNRQIKFNKLHSSTRNVMERTNGVLKGKFQCLQKTLHYVPEKVSKIVNICCALHNMCIHHKVPSEPHEYLEEESDSAVYEADDHTALPSVFQSANNIRNNIMDAIC